MAVGRLPPRRGTENITYSGESSGFMRYSRSPAGAIRVLFVALIPLFAVASSSALPPDPRILALVPPGSRIVAGMTAPQSVGQPGSFLLVTVNNTADLEEFFALTGSDESRFIHQVILKAAAIEPAI